MKRKSLLIITILLLAAAVTPAEEIVLDLKTPLKEKGKFLALQAGALYYLNTNGYKTLEIGEDYAVWLKDYQKTVEGNQITISFTCKITAPCGWREKKALTEERISLSYNVDKIETISINEPMLDYLEEKFDYLSRSMQAEAVLGGKLIHEAIVKLLKEIA
jgi:hypothetical protein